MEPLSPADVARFQQDGYFIARQVFSADERADLEARALGLKARAVDALMDGLRFWTGKHPLRELTDDQRRQASWGVNEITRPELFDPMLINVFGHPVVNQHVNALLDEPRAWGLKMLWTPKLVGYDLGWHRDQMKRDLYDYAHYKPAAQDHVQFNAALHDDDCFLVVPGSHRRPLTAEEWRALNEEPNAPLTGQVVAALEPGDILYMDAHTLHRGRSPVDGDRLTLHYSAQAQWVPLKPWGDPEHFAWITSDAFLDQLNEGTRPLYERLKTAPRADEPMTFLKEAAAAHGWVPAGA